MAEREYKTTRIDEIRLSLDRTGQMITDATIFASDKIKLEPDAISQLYDAACLPPARKVLATADLHVGFGVPIGSVIGMDNAIMPAAVGYDVNCGMRLLRTPFFKGQIDIEKIANSIAREIPLGEGKSNLALSKDSLEAVVSRGVGTIAMLAQKTSHRAWDAFDPAEFHDDTRCIEESGSMPGNFAAVPALAIQKGADQLGTLGGGNHFIEIQAIQQILDNDLARLFGLSCNQIVVMIHSGSRRFGYEVADEYMRAAAASPQMQGRPPMLSYLSTDAKLGSKYIDAMYAAANFAFVNRQIMTLLVRRCFNYMFGKTPLQLIYDVPHNMAKLEQHGGKQLWVHRKGATRAFGPDRMRGTDFARTGQPIITPGSMGTASYLMVGTGDSDESLCSVNHGAGRVMSRSAATGKSRRGKTVKPPLISDDEFKRSMSGVKLITANKKGIKEEAPGAYKDIDEVVRIVVASGWAKAVARMVPLAVLKG
ncbi:MAG: RtcB family protein [Planctomycetota bacterium]